LNLDENPGQVAPFLKSNGNTFPVVFARQYVEDLLGPFTIPQNGVVKRDAVVREKSVGFDAALPDWPKQMLEKIVSAGDRGVGK
jgi:hypothetical protein